MMFTILYILLGLALPVGCSIWMRKIWKNANQRKKMDVELAGIFVVIGAVAGSVCFFVFMPNITASLFDYSRPTCIEHVGTVPVHSHWTNPEKNTIQIPNGFPSYVLLDMQSTYIKQHWWLQDGDRISASNRKYVLSSKDAPRDSAKFYRYKYKDWGPFECPKFLRQGHICFGEPDVIKRGQCQVEVEIK